MNWYLAVLKKYAVAEGRARRKEFWMFALVHVLVLVALIIVSGVVGVVSESLRPLAGIPFVLYILGTGLPSMGVTIRRLHYTGHSGWWLLLGPVAFVFSLLDSESDDNPYGPNPKD
ncbi:MAG: DUF805 domain-containing protein [Puniceicoccales bacterium]|jgi:uncharacterized membrane protein YhaH (DUF805 family)|nr:DUF805 domain-containing protein [Puniceicoccales bacterium]